MSLLVKLLAAKRERFLLVVGADPKRWAQRYGIEPFTHPCGDCGAQLTTTRPFACGALRGLIAPLCACGALLPPYCIVEA